MSALDDQVRETVSRVLESIRGRLESELGTCRDELVRAAQEATRAAAEAAESANAEIKREAERELAELRESTARDAEEQRARLSAEIEDLQRRLNESAEERQRLSEEHERRLEESRLRIEAAGRDADLARSEAESARQRADAAREEADTAARDLESARGQLDATRENVEATLRDIESVRRDSDATRAEVIQLNETLRERDDRAAQAARLPEAVRTLDVAATFGEVLESLARLAGRESGRAAVFLVKGDRLRDWRTVGFDFASDAARLDIGFSDSGLIAEAVRSGQCVRLNGEHPLPDFANVDEVRTAAAWPVSVGGSVVAVLYADASVADKPDEPYWPAFLDVLALHAGRVLEGITVRQAAGLMTGRPIGIAQRERASSSAARGSSGSIQ